MCELGIRLQRLYEYRQLRERWAQMAYLDAKSARIAAESEPEIDERLSLAEEHALADWTKARTDYESIETIWAASKRLEEQAAEQAQRRAA